MANFELKEISLGQINNGEKYENGDRPNAEAFNAPIEASAYAQKIAKEAKEAADNAMQKVNDSAAGAVTLSAYPVGSIYLSVSETSPASLFGGTWERIKDRFLLAAGDTYAAGETGGKSDHYHDAGNLGAQIQLGNNYIRYKNHDVDSYTSNWNMSLSATETAGGTSCGSAVDVIGKTASETNLPPYLTVYVWQRVG